MLRLLPRAPRNIRLLVVVLSLTSIITMLTPPPVAAQPCQTAMSTVTVDDRGNASLNTNATEFHPSRAIVRFRPGRPADILPGSGTARAFPGDRSLYLVENPPGLSVAEVLRRYRANPNVLYTGGNVGTSAAVTVTARRGAPSGNVESIEVAAHMAIKLVLVESQSLIREALQSLLQATGDVIVVGGAGRAQELLDVVEAHQPDVVLLALDGRGERDAALLRELPALSARARTLVLAPDVDASLEARAIQLGAMGVVLKSQSAQLLMKAVQKIHEGQLWLGREHTADIVDRLLTNATSVRPPSLRSRIH